MAVVNGIAGILKAILNGIVAVFDIIVGCLTCNRAGGRRRRRLEPESGLRRRVVAACHLDHRLRQHLAERLPGRAVGRVQRDRALPYVSFPHYTQGLK